MAASKASPQYWWFAFILYPEEDSGHAAILDYLKQNTMLYKNWCAVQHDRDFYDDDEHGRVYVADFIGDLDDGIVRPTDTLFEESLITGKAFKKPHWHVLVRSHKKMTISGFLRRWVRKNEKGIAVPLLQRVEAIEDYFAYIQYMAHIDFASIADKCKSQYSAEEFIGTPSLIASALEKTEILSNWQLLGGMYSAIRLVGFEEFAKEASEMPLLDSERCFGMFKQFQHLMMSASYKYEYNHSFERGMDNVQQQQQQ